MRASRSRAAGACFSPGPGHCLQLAAALLLSAFARGFSLLCSGLKPDQRSPRFARAPAWHRRRPGLAPPGALPPSVRSRDDKSVIAVSRNKCQEVFQPGGGGLQLSSPPGDGAPHPWLVPCPIAEVGDSCSPPPLSPARCPPPLSQTQGCAFAEPLLGISRGGAQGPPPRAGRGARPCAAPRAA